MCPRCDGCNESPGHVVLHLLVAASGGREWRVRIRVCLACTRRHVAPPRLAGLPPDADVEVCR